MIHVYHETWSEPLHNLSLIWPFICTDVSLLRPLDTGAHCVTGCCVVTWYKGFLMAGCCVWRLTHLSWVLVTCVMFFYASLWWSLPLAYKTNIKHECVQSHFILSDPDILFKALSKRSFTLNGHVLLTYIYLHVLMFCCPLSSQASCNCQVVRQEGLRFYRVLCSRQQRC